MKQSELNKGEIYILDFKGTRKYIPMKYFGKDKEDKGNVLFKFILFKRISEAILFDDVLSLTPKILKYIRKPTKEEMSEMCLEEL